MDGFVKVGRVEDFVPGAIHPVDVGGAPVAVVNVEGELHAISDFCPHEGITLSAGYGMVHGTNVICMMHTSLFEVGSGEVIAGPSDSGLSKYAVVIDGDDVYVSTKEQS